MDTLLYNAKIYIKSGRFAEAVLVRGNRIIGVGGNEELKAMAEADCRTIDCEGRTLVPGFNDSHMHLMEYGEGLRQARVSEAGSIEELVEICRTFAEEHPDRVAEGLHAAGWNQDRFQDQRIPNRYDLDRISTSFPVVLERICGHIICANSRAIEMLGLSADSPQYPDGRFGTFPGGEPDGTFFGGACLHVRKLIPEFTDAQRLDILENAMEEAASLGVTCVQSNDVGAMSGSHEDNFRLFHRLYEEGRGRIRFRHQVNFESLEAFRECLTRGEYAHAKELYPAGSLLTLGPLKLYKDGSLGARTALMKNGYLGAPMEHGLEWYSDEEMMEHVRLACEHGIQAVTHCIGDAAVSQTADCYIRCNHEVLHTEGNPLRHALVHCQITDREILERIATHGLLAMVQPVFLEADLAVLGQLIDPELAASSYAFGSLISSGGKRISFGTDCPVETCDPFQNIYCAVTRKRLDGTPEEGFTPEEQITAEQAVDAYTAGSAYAMFMEDCLGRIAPGYLADLVLLDQDIFICRPEEIPAIRPVLTMADGRIIYERTS